MAITQIRGAQVLDASIDENDLNTSVAGNGLAGGGGSALSVNVDDTSIEITTDTLNIKALGVDTAELQADAVTGAKIEDDAVDSEHIAAGAIDLAHMSVNSVDSDQYVDASIDNEHLANNAVDTEELAADAVDGTRIADDAVDSEHIASGAVDVDHLSDLRVTEGTGLVADFAAGTVSTDNGTTVTVLSVSAGTTTVTDDDESFVEVDISGTVSNNIVGFTQGRLPLARVTAAAGDITVVVDSRAWLDIDLGGDVDTGLVTANFVDNEVPTGDLDGADVTYTLANTPSPTGSLKVYLNGIRQDEGASDDYTLTTNVITFAAAPISTDKILADYRKA